VKEGEKKLTKEAKVLLVAESITLIDKKYEELSKKHDGSRII